MQKHKERATPTRAQATAWCQPLVPGPPVQSRAARDRNPGRAASQRRQRWVVTRAPIWTSNGRATRTPAPGTAWCQPLVPGPPVPNRAARGRNPGRAASQRRRLLVGTSARI